MPTGTTLVNLRKMLNAELGAEMDETISPANVANQNQVLNNQQKFLVNQHAYLLGKVRAEVPLTTGTQYYALPSGIDMDRLDQPVFTNVSNFRYRVGYGIGQDEYNYWDSSRGLKATPVMKWDRLLIGGVKQIEVWPIPLVPQTLMFSGAALLTDMVNDSDTCVIDDLVLVLFTAAEMQARQQAGDTQAKLEKAKAALASIRATFPSRFETLNIAGGHHHEDLLGFGGNGRRPVVATNG